MGWMTIYDLRSKQDMIDYLTDHVNGVGRPTSNGDYFYTVKSCFRGFKYSGKVWSVMEHRNQYHKVLNTFIALFLIAKDGDAWSYKDMDESCGPHYFDCPPVYLKLAPYNPERDHNGYAKEWRERCVKYWEAKKLYSLKNLNLEVGSTYKLNRESNPTSITVTSIHPLRGTGNNGMYYRLTKKNFLNCVKIEKTKELV